MLPDPPLWMVVVAFVCALGPLVFFHELGHYLVARMFGIPAETFSIGFGRELFGWNDRQGTRWRVAWLPLGGYVKFVGDMSPVSEPASLDELAPELRARVFQARPVWQRFLVVLAGPLANFLLAILIFAGFFTLVTAPMSNTVGAVQPDSAAARASIAPGDRILSVAGQPTPAFGDIRSAVEPVPGQTVPVVLQRDGQTQTVSVAIGRKDLKDEAGRSISIGLLGVTPGAVSPFEAVPMAVRYTGEITIVMVKGVARLLTGGGSRDEVGGPIKIAQIAGQAASLGALAFVQLLALFSINLGFINLLPVPMLDGGHLLFYAVEGIRRRPISARALEWAFRGGLAVILALVVFTTINDLGSIGLWDRLQRLIG